LWGDWVLLYCADEQDPQYPDRRGIRLKELYVSDQLGSELRIGLDTELFLEPDAFARIGLIPEEGTSDDFHKLVYGPGSATIDVYTEDDQQPTILDFGEKTCIQRYTLPTPTAPALT
jgi:hypothetical protein